MSEPPSNELALVYRETDPMTIPPKRHVVDTLGDAPESRFTQLHESVEGQSLPPLRPDFVAHLDKVCGLADLTDAQRLHAAMERLAHESPELHTAVVLMAEPKATVRSVGALIGVSGKTACKRHNRGLDKLRAWCRDDSPPSSNVA